MKKEVGK
jgi:hypothetical protein